MKDCSIMVFSLIAIFSFVVRAGEPSREKGKFEDPGNLIEESIILSDEERGDFFKSNEFTKPILSVELQYYRVRKDKWDMMLTRMAQYNANTISSYVCWAWHEYDEGRFDFRGETIPERDLIGFVELVGKRGFKLILKPGPYIDAELNAGGVPEWVFENYPETIAKNSLGRQIMHSDSEMPRASYLHPKYLELTEKYYKALFSAIGKYQWPNGPIIAIQIDNEAPGNGFQGAYNYLLWNFKADYNDYYKKIAWPEWLKNNYGEIEKLNEAYGSGYSSFSDVPMPNKWDDPKTEKGFKIYVDLDKFAEWQTNEALRRMREMLRSAGFYVPTYHDLLCMPWDRGGITVDIGGIAEAVGGWLGNNVYPEIFRIWELFSSPAGAGYNFDEYVHLAIWRTKLLESLSKPYPSFVPEISCALRFFFQAPIAWGADAVNLYVGSQVSHDNALISPLKSWAMEACVTSDGKIRNCFWNAKLTYMFMEYSGGFVNPKESPLVAIGYSHIPENYYNFEYRFNFNMPEKKPKLKRFQSLVKGNNTADRSQLIAKNLVNQKIDFDVVHLDHLKPGQLEPYKLIAIPSTSAVPLRKETTDELQRNWNLSQLYLSEATTDYPFSTFEKQGLKLKRAYSDSPFVDVVERSYAPQGPRIISIVNRGKKEFASDVYFDYGSSNMSVVLGPKAIGFVAIKDDGISCALIDHPKGRGEYSFRNDKMAFTGSFSAIVSGDGFILISALDSGKVSIKSKFLEKPSKLIRLLIDGRTMEAPFSYEDGVFSFNYEPGKKDELTDMYIALSKDISLENAISDYLKRTARLQ